MNQFIRFPIQIITSGIIEFMEKSHLRVYMCLDAHKSRNSWQAFPSLATIRSEIRMNTATIQRAIRDLIEWGLIKKAHVKRAKGSGYRIVYTLVKEPSIKTPHKRVRKKIFSTAKRKRDLKGKFTGLKQPYERSVSKRLKQPHDLAVSQRKKSKQPYQMGTTTYPYQMGKNKSKQPSDMANNQFKDLSSIEPVKKNPPHNSTLKRKPKINTGEKAFAKQTREFVAKSEEAKKKEAKNDQKTTT